MKEFIRCVDNEIYNASIDQYQTAHSVKNVSPKISTAFDVLNDQVLSKNFKSLKERKTETLKISSVVVEATAAIVGCCVLACMFGGPVGIMTGCFGLVISLSACCLSLANINKKSFCYSKFKGVIQEAGKIAQQHKDYSSCENRNDIDTCYKLCYALQFLRGSVKGSWDFSEYSIDNIRFLLGVEDGAHVSNKMHIFYENGFVDTDANKELVKYCKEDRPLVIQYINNPELLNKLSYLEVVELSKRFRRAYNMLIVYDIQNMYAPENLNIAYWNNAYEFRATRA